LRGLVTAIAAEWGRRMTERGFDAAGAAAPRGEAEALAAAVVDAAVNDAHPTPAALARHVQRLVEMRAAGGTDPYDLVEALDLLSELLHEALEAGTNPTPASGSVAAADARRLARATRGLVASALLAQPAHDATPTGERDGHGTSAPTDAAGAANGAADFVRRLAHDLKNPLGTALGAAETLTDDDALADGAMRQQFADIVKRNIRRAVELIEEARRGL
jgi:signal transduction histidine kinase